jgi:hypothetical protein
VPCEWINFTLCQSIIHSLLFKYTTLEVLTELPNLDVVIMTHRKCVHFYAFPWFYSVLCRLWNCDSIWRRLLLSIYVKIETLWPRCWLHLKTTLKWNGLQPWAAKNSKLLHISRNEQCGWRYKVLRYLLSWAIRRVVPGIWNDHSAFIYKAQTVFSHCFTLEGNDTTTVKYAQNLSSNDMASRFRRLWCTATKPRKI